MPGRCRSDNGSFVKFNVTASPERKLASHVRILEGALSIGDRRPNACS